MISPARSNRREHLDVLAASCGALALAVAIGFGRFGFTALSPLMIQDGILDLRGQAIAQAVHFLGYFVGAIMVLKVPRGAVAITCAAGLLASVVMLVATAFALTRWSICFDRFLSGAASAVVMVMASTWLFQTAGIRWAPLLYGGAGLGIVAAGESVVMLVRNGASEESAWLALAMTAGTLMLPPLVALMTNRRSMGELQKPLSARPDISPYRLVIVYAAGGSSYIISATYLPALVANGPYHLDPVHVFSFFGLCVIPSCYIWLRIDAKFGTRRALAVNYSVQALGTVLPMVSLHPAALIGAAAAVGGTFMGVVAMAMAAGRRHAPGLGYNLMAVLTAAYALGQAVGPTASALISGQAINLNLSLGLAAVVLLLSIAAMLAPDRVVSWRLWVRIAGFGSDGKAGFLRRMSGM
jgi:hypothetical protein